MKRYETLLMFLFVCACQPPPTSPASTATLPPPNVVIETNTSSPIPTLTLTPSATPTIEEAIFPYTIEGLRRHEFQSGEIQIRETLDETEFFSSYLIEYPSDGLTITGVMQIPKGDGPFPVIVMNHGFFSRSVYKSGDGTDRASAFLAEHGYITLASDYRTWGESDAGPSFFYSGLVSDVVNLIKAIPFIREADPERVGIWGHSMGGGVTMKVLTVLGDPDTSREDQRDRSTTVKAAVLYSTVSADDADVIYRWGMGCFGDFVAGEQIVGCNSSDIIPFSLPLRLQDAYRFTANNEEALKKVSPFYHLDYVDVPIQIHYGIEDGKFIGGTPPEWSVKLTQALRDAGKDVELYQYEGEGHSFIGEPWFEFARRTLWFFDANVKNTGS